LIHTSLLALAANALFDDLAMLLGAATWGATSLYICTERLIRARMLGVHAAGPDDEYSPDIRKI
jgi:hypothetical protein